MDSSTPSMGGAEHLFRRVRVAINRGMRVFRRGPDERDVSMTDTDENATKAASVAQTASDVDDRKAGAPAEQGGEG